MFARRMTEHTEIEVNGTIIGEGTAVFDTEFDRVLWIAEIDDHQLTVEVAESYEDDEPIWWSSGGDPTRVGDGSQITIAKFRSLVEAGRFEISPQPSEADVSC
jgi:hypothetical protein